MELFARQVSLFPRIIDWQQTVKINSRKSDNSASGGHAMPCGRTERQRRLSIDLHAAADAGPLCESNFKKILLLVATKTLMSALHERWKSNFSANLYNECEFALDHIKPY